MTQVLAVLLAIFKAVPTIEIWWGRLIAEYIKISKLKIAKENKAAIIKAIKDQDQRGLEDEEHSGKPSGVGTFRPYLPGVHNSKKS
jgi:hypothetical protein